MSIVLIFGIVLGAPSLFAQERLTQEYRIGPKDVLDIGVVGEAELSRVVRVSQDGTISFPFLGSVDVEGLTKGQLELKLNQLLIDGNFLENPQVIVFIQEYQSKRVAVIGAVNIPGTFELLGRQTLRQIIAQAGGVTAEAGDQIEIIRTQEQGGSSILRISIRELYSDADMDIPLQANDIVRVPNDELVNIYVGGNVGNPGMLEVRESQIPTLLQAIIQAGGFSERAAKGSVTLKRQNEDGSWNTQKIDVDDIIKGKRDDIQLQANDIIWVSQSIF